MSYHPSLPWPQIHEYLLKIEQTDQPVSLCKQAVLELNQLMPYDAAYIFLLNEKFQIADHEVIGVPEKKIRQYLDYYVTIDPCKQRTPPGARTWLIDWYDFYHTEFCTDWGRPVDLYYTTSMYLHNQKQIPSAVLITSRSGHYGFSDRELAILEVIQPHLSNHFRLLEKMRPVRSQQFNCRNLTKRENEIAGLLCQGLSTPEIATLLVISEFTVYRHLNNIFTKMNISSRTELVAKLLTGD